MKQDDKQRGEYAHQILANPVFKQACDVLKNEIIEKWSECPARDMEGKEYLWQLYRNTIKFENIFRGYVEAGKIQIQREQQEQSAQRQMLDNVTKFFKRS